MLETIPSDPQGEDERVVGLNYVCSVEIFTSFKRVGIPTEQS